MQTYLYTALDSKGEKKTSAISARNEGDAIQQIRALNLHPIQVSELSAKDQGRTTKEVEICEVGDVSVLKCIGNSLVYGFIGFVVCILGYIVLKILVGLLFWNAQLGTTVAEFSILAIPAGLIIGFLEPINAASKAKRDAEESSRRRLAEEEDAKRRRLVEAEVAERRRLGEETTKLNAECKDLALMLKGSRSKYHSLSSLVGVVGSLLDTAEEDFKERAFAPFWDALESATNHLGEYHQNIEAITNTASEYEKRRCRLSTSVPAFDIPKSSVPDARPIASRLSELCRAAQKDFQFATIYEQRKTNQLLYAGFGTLASGLANMQNAISTALNGLSQTLGSRLDDILVASRSQAESLNELMTEAHSQTDALDALLAVSETQVEHLEEAKHETKKQSEMLDNIQREKKPPEGTLERVFHYRPDGETRTAHDVSADD